MAKYIDREAFERFLMSETSEDDICDDCLQNMIDEMTSFPTTDVAEVRHGKWLLEREPNGKPYCYHCSVCDDDFHYIGITMASDYCPNCGAKMGGDEE